MKNTNIRSGARGIPSGTLVLQDRTIQLTPNDFVAGSISIKSGTSNASEITVGAAIISSLDFMLMNHTGKFSGLNWFDSKVNLTITVDGTPLDMGEYYVVKHYERGNVITVETYDALKILDEYQIYEDHLVYPCDAADIVRTICANRGLTADIPTSGIMVDDPEDDRMTERACISYLAQLMGCFVTCFRNRLRFRWYDTSTVYDAGTTFSHDLRTEDITVTGVKVTTGKGDKVQSFGTSGYTLNVSDNPFITENNLVYVANHMYNSVNGLRFRPGTVSICNNPAIEAGDCLRINTGQEQGIIILATTVTYKTSVLRQTITADAEPYSGDLRINRSQYVQKQAQKVIDDALAGKDTDLGQMADEIEELKKGGSGGVTLDTQKRLYIADPMGVKGILYINRQYITLPAELVDSFEYGQAQFCTTLWVTRSVGGGIGFNSVGTLPVAISRQNTPVDADIIVDICVIGPFVPLKTETDGTYKLYETPFTAGMFNVTQNKWQSVNGAKPVFK